MLDRHEVILSKSSILLAEDDINIRESFKKVLLLYVDTVYEAANGEEAYELYATHKPDILITDIKMPKKNGLELIKEIRQSNKNIPIVVTSAYADQDFLLESIKLSLVEYLIKPIKESDLNEVLMQCAEGLSNFSKSIIIFDDGSAYDYDNKTFTCNTEELELTSKEIEFFELLLAHRGNLVTKHTIEAKIYIYEEAPPSALKNLVFKLRKRSK